MLKPYRIALGAWSFVVMMSACSASSPSDVATWKEDMGASIQKLDQAELWVAGEVGVVYRDQQSVQPYGEISPGTGVPPTSDSAFEIGSISKSFTGILLAEISDEVAGISIDDPLSKYIPELAGTFSGQITFHQLATHTSGLPRMPCTDPTISYCFNPKDPDDPYVDYTAAQLLAYVESYSPSGSGPYAADYSNTGFALLGYALTRIENQSFDDLLSERITTPLGMSRTLVLRPETQVSAMPSLLNAYNVGRIVVKHWQWDVFASAGGIVSTADDMMKYLAANVGPGDTALGRAMQKSHTLGLGWDSAVGASTLWKNGQTGGFTSMILFDPATQAGTFVLSNIASIYSTVVPCSPTTLAATCPAGELPDLMGLNVPQTKLDAYVGSYENTAIATSVQVSRPGKFLIATVTASSVFPPGATFRLDATSDTEFNMYDGASAVGYNTLSFVTQADATVSGLVARLNDGSGGYTDIPFARE